MSDSLRVLTTKRRSGSLIINIARISFWHLSVACDEALLPLNERISVRKGKLFAHASGDPAIECVP